MNSRDQPPKGLHMKVLRTRTSTIGEASCTIDEASFAMGLYKL